MLGGPMAPVLAIALTLKPGASPQSAASQILKDAEDAHQGLANLNKLEVRAAILGDMAGALEALPGRTEIYADYAQFEPGVDFGAEVKRLEEFDGSQLKDV